MIAFADLASGHHYHYRFWQVVSPVSLASSGSKDASSCLVALRLSSNRPSAAVDSSPIGMPCSTDQWMALQPFLLKQTIQPGSPLINTKESVAYIPLVVDDTQTPYGLLEIRTDAGHIDQIQHGIYRRFWIIFLISYGVMLVLIHRLAGVMTRPLLALRQQAERIAAGNYPAMHPTSLQFHSDELGALAATLHRMGENIRDREQHLLMLQTQQEAMLQWVQESEEKLNIVVHNTTDAILILTVGGQVRFANPAACRLFERPLDELLNHDMGVPVMADAVAEIEIPTKTGAMRIGEMRVVVTVWNGEEVYIASIRDVSDRKEAEKRLLHNALYDPLTQLPNRAYFMYQLRRIVQHIQQKKAALAALLFIDLDEFKVVNDSLGHLVGDRLLVETGKRLTSFNSEHCFVARLGGDEFAILLSQIETLETISAIAEQVLDALRQPLHLPGHPSDLFVSASIGIALTHNPATDQAYTHPLEMLRDADTAMYCAKKNGKDHYEFFNRQMYVNAATRLSLETDLRQAIAHRELSLCYQPIFSLETGRLRSFEALARWRHPQHGWISPNEFIPVAEETGLIVPLGHWVLETACRQLREWQWEQLIADTVMMSVNLTGRQFLQSTLADDIYAILTQTSLSASNLLLEVTESSIDLELDRVNQILNTLKAIGIRIAIDDFGTGYSSLSRLHQMPVDCLKIDRSFIQRMAESQENQEFVQAILRFAQVLHIDVIAEGIETERQKMILSRMRCKYGQGYFYAKPLTATQVLDLLHRLNADTLPV